MSYQQLCDSSPYNIQDAGGSASGVFLIMKRGFFVLSITMAAALSGAQSINLDFNSSGVGSIPASTYGAAGSVGAWNAANIETVNSPVALFDLSGAATSAVYSVNTWQSFSWDSGGTWLGNDRSLMEDWFNATASISFTGLQDGLYEIIMYGQNSGGFGGSFTIGSTTQSTTGGAWTGNFVEGASHTVFSSVAVSGGSLAIRMEGAANGMQLRYLGGDPVPEPFTMSLLGAAALVGYRRIRSKRA